MTTAPAANRLAALQGDRRVAVAACVLDEAGALVGGVSALRSGAGLLAVGTLVRRHIRYV